MDQLLPVITFIVYRVLLFMVRLISYHPPSFDSLACDPTWQMIVGIWEAWHPKNLTVFMFICKVLCVSLLVGVFIVMGKNTYFKAHIFNVWYFLIFMYVSTILCYSFMKYFYLLCYTITPDYYNYGILLFIAIFAINNAYHQFEGQYEMTFSIGWLVLSATIMFYFIMTICYLLYHAESKLYEYIFSIFKTETQDNPWGKFFTLLMSLTDSQNINFNFINYIFTPMNIVGIATVFLLIIYVIMAEYTDPKSEERLNRVNSLCAGFAMMLFFVLSLITYYMDNYGIINHMRVFYNTLIGIIITCILVATYRQLFMQKKAEEDD